jgi:hypothetical protein
VQPKRAWKKTKTTRACVLCRGKYADIPLIFSCDLRLQAIPVHATGLYTFVPCSIKHYLFLFKHVLMATTYSAHSTNVELFFPFIEAKFCNLKILREPPQNVV